MWVGPLARDARSAALLAAVLGLIFTLPAFFLLRNGAALGSHVSRFGLLVGGALVGIAFGAFVALLPVIGIAIQCSVLGCSM